MNIGEGPNPYQAPLTDLEAGISKQKRILEKQYGVSSDLPDEDIKLLFNLHQRNQVRGKRARKEKIGTTIGGIGGATTSIAGLALKSVLLGQGVPAGGVPESLDMWLGAGGTLAGAKLGHSIASKKHRRLPIAKNDVDFVNAYRETGRIQSEALAESIVKVVKKPKA